MSSSSALAPIPDSTVLDTGRRSGTDGDETERPPSQEDGEQEGFDKNKASRPIHKKIFRCVLLFFPLIIPFIAYIRGTDPASQILLVLFIVLLVVIFSCVLTALLKVRARLADRAGRRELEQHHVFAITSRFLPLTLPYGNYSPERPEEATGTTPPPYYCIAMQTVTTQPDRPPSYEEALYCPSPSLFKEERMMAGTMCNSFELPPPDYETVVK
ncbi:uncharacterized protein [Centruroides vittatus]|uniref:uncharacterized protein n=1 Tax=Centruroides vittatus TaxID=120091 RepID=UPI0035101754